jgi:hypothetical protein
VVLRLVEQVQRFDWPELARLQVADPELEMNARGEREELQVAESFQLGPRPPSVLMLGGPVSVQHISYQQPPSPLWFVSEVGQGVQIDRIQEL